MSDDTTPEQLCHRVELFARTVAGFVGASIRSREPLVIQVAFTSKDAAHEYALALEAMGRPAATIAMAPGDDTTVHLKWFRSGGSATRVTNQSGEPLAGTSNVTSLPRSNEATAWSRWFARVWFDYVFFGIVLALLIGFIAPQSGILESDYALYWLTVVLWIPVEAVLIATVGRTPGKALLGLRVARSDGARLSSSQALRRAAAVFVKGCGLGIPIVSLFTFNSEYKRVRAGKLASWDEVNGFVVTPERLSMGKKALLAIVVLAVVSLMVLGTTSSTR